MNWYFEVRKVDSLIKNLCDEKLGERIEVNPKILGGKPVIKGTRIPVYLVLELLSAGYDFKRIIQAYPALSEEDIKAAVNYAVQIVKNEEAFEYAVS